MFPIKYEIHIWHLNNLIFSLFTIVGIYKITSKLFNSYNISKQSYVKNIALSAYMTEFKCFNVLTRHYNSKHNDYFFLHP